MARYPKYSDVSYSFGPGPPSPAIKILIIANVAAFVLSSIVPQIIGRLGLMPAAVFEQLAIWQPVTYMFLHGGIGHLLFNMLALWMFGTDLERMWGTRFFTKYYFVTGVGAAATSLLWALSPLPFADQIYYTPTIGASGAGYGVLLAYAMYFPHRPIYLYFVFPIPARVFRDDHWRHHLLLFARWWWRRCAHGASWWVAGWLFVFEGPPHSSARRAEVSVAAMEDESRAREVRCASGRPARG